MTLILHCALNLWLFRTGTGSGRSKGAAAAGAGGGGRKGGAAAVLSPVQLKWLKTSGIDDVKLVNLSWAKLISPDKKGRWGGGQLVDLVRKVGGEV